MSLAEKGQRFRELHARDTAFVIPNPWDIGTARIFAALGFEALATTSAGLAFGLGRQDAKGAVRRDEVLAHIAEIAGATDLPVSADLENGFGDAPETAAETITLAAGAGMVGGSIEDATGDPDAPIYDFDHAVERVAASVEAARKVPHPFMMTARAENYLYGRRDLDDTIRRLQAFEAAGADVLYAPGLRDIGDIRTLCAALSKSVNVVMGIAGAEISIDELTAAGVKRISVGSALARAALGEVLRAATEIKEKGTFTWGARAASFAELNAVMSDRAPATD